MSSARSRWTWSSVAPTSAQSGLLANRYGGQAWDLDDNDDVNQFVFIVSRRDKPEGLQGPRRSGRAGGQLRRLLRLSNPELRSDRCRLGETPPADQFVPRSLKSYTPDVWGRLGWKNIELEFEGVASLGSMEATDLGVDGELSIRQYGAVLRSTFRFFGGDLRLGTELGWASGDSQDNTVQGSFTSVEPRCRAATTPRSTSSFSTSTTTSISFCGASSTERSPTPSTSNRALNTT